MIRCLAVSLLPKNNKTPGGFGGLGAHTDSALHHRRDQDMNLFASMFKPVPNELWQFGLGRPAFLLMSPGQEILADKPSAGQ